MRYLGINLIKKVNDLYTENYKTLMKEIEDTNKWKDIPCSWIAIIKTVKVSILPKVMYRFHEIFIKITMAFFTELEQMNHKGPQRAKTILRKKNKAGEFIFSDFKTYYKATVIKTVWY